MDGSRQEFEDFLYAAPDAALELAGIELRRRNLIPAELGKGFGFLQSKPSSALSPASGSIR